MTKASETFARRLREERRRAGLTQAVLAERMTAVLNHTVHASAVALSEKDQRAVRLDEAVVIAELLDLPLTTLLRDREQVDDEIAELQETLAMEKWRADEMRATLQRTQDTIAGVSRRIAELEAARGD